MWQIWTEVGHLKELLLEELRQKTKKGIYTTIHRDFTLSTLSPRNF